MSDSKVRSEALAANITVHSALANTGEYNRSPHFRAENQEKVRGILEYLVSNHLPAENRRLLDLGCGTGFIIHLAHDLFTTIHGIDITDDMMKQIDLSSGNIELFTGEAENTPFENDSYDMVTAYSFLDHVVSHKDVLSEAFRVLKRGGVFYTDLNPNRLFAETMVAIEAQGLTTLPHIISREIKGMLHNGDYYEENFGIDADTLTAAEPIKSIDNGFDPYEFIQTAKELGFANCRFEVDWYLGQAKVMHEGSLEDSDVVEKYLRSALPATTNLFKYLRFVLVK